MQGPASSGKSLKHNTAASKGYVLKAYYECVGSEDAFFDNWGYCTLKEITNETKIIEKKSGDIIIQVQSMKSKARQFKKFDN